MPALESSSADEYSLQLLRTSGWTGEETLDLRGKLKLRAKSDGHGVGTVVPTSQKCPGQHAPEQFACVRFVAAPKRPTGQRLEHPALL